MEFKILNQSANYLRVLDVEDRETSEGLAYQVLSVSALPKEIEIGGKKVSVKSNQKVRTLTVFGKSEEYGAGDALYGDVEKGDIVEGQITTLESDEPYEITDEKTGEIREVHTMTVATLSGQDPIVKAENLIGWDRSVKSDYASEQVDKQDAVKGKLD